jgi:hypothetical protein
VRGAPDLRRLTPRLVVPFGKGEHGTVASGQRVDEGQNLFGPVCAPN